MHNTGNNINCIVFDFDGTLVDSNEIKHQTFFDVTSHLEGARKILNYALSDDTFGDRFDVFKYIEKKIKLADPDCQISALELTDQYTLICENKIIQAPEIEGASIALVNLLKNGINMVVSSATPEPTLKNIISMRGWEGFFSHIFGRPASKTQHIEAVMQIYQCDISEIIYVGDSEIDQIAAKNQGCHFIGVGKDNLRFDTEPDILLPTLKLLPQMVEKINQ